MIRSTTRSLIAVTVSTAITVTAVVTSALVSVSMSSSAAAAQPAPPASPSTSLTVDQVRDSFTSDGFQVDQAHSWDWMSPPVTSFQVHDQTGDRVLMVLVYANSTTAQTARLQAQANEYAQNASNTASVNSGPILVEGYGPSLWMGNVALAQTTQRTLDRLFQWQIDRSNDLDFDTNRMAEPSSSTNAVDFDFQQALDNSAVNL